QSLDRYFAKTVPGTEAEVPFRPLALFKKAKGIDIKRSLLVLRVPEHGVAQLISTIGKEAVPASPTRIEPTTGIVARKKAASELLKKADDFPHQVLISSYRDHTQRVVGEKRPRELGDQQTFKGEVCVRVR